MSSGDVVELVEFSDEEAGSSHLDGAGEAKATEGEATAAEATEAKVTEAESQATEAQATAAADKEDEDDLRLPLAEDDDLYEHVADVSDLSSDESGKVHEGARATLPAGQSEYIDEITGAPLEPVCGVPRTLKRVLFVVSLLAVGCLWALYETLPSRLPLLHSASLHANVLSPIVVVACCAGAARILLDWKPEREARGQNVPVCRKQFAPAAFLVLLVSYAVVSLLDALPDTVVSTATEPKLGGNCSVVDFAELSSLCTDQRIIGQMNPRLGFGFDGVESFMLQVNGLLLQIPQIADADVTEEQQAECSDFIRDSVCQGIVQRCDAQCNPLPACNGLCTEMMEKCDWLAPFFALLQNPLLADALESVMPQPTSFSLPMFIRFATCSTADDEPEEDWLRLADPPRCSGKYFAEDPADFNEPCHVDGYFSRLSQYELFLEQQEAPSSDDGWILRRHLIRSTFVLLLWLVPIVDLAMRPRKRPLARSAAHAVRGAVSLSFAASKKFLPVGSAYTADATPKSAGSPSDVVVNPFGEASSPRRQAWTPEPVRVHISSAKPAYFLHVVGIRGIIIALIMCANIGVAIQMAFLTESAGDVWLSVVATFVALVATIAPLSRIAKWRDVYSGAIRTWLYGTRNYSFFGPEGDSSWLRKLNVARRRMALAYGMRFGMAGSWFGVRIFVTESVEVSTQLFGLLSNIEVAPNQQVVVKLVLITVNVLGSWFLAVLPHTNHSNELHTVFDLAIDFVYITYNVATLDAGVINSLQAAAIFLPIVLAATTLRGLLRQSIITEARADLEALHVRPGFRKHHWGAPHRVRGFGAITEADYQGRAKLRRVSSRRLLTEQLRSLTSRGGLGAVLLAVVTCCGTVTLLTSTLMRIVSTDAQCSAEMGSVVWDGVSLTDKRFFSNGLFQSASCAYPNVKSLDLQGTDVEVIDDAVGALVGLERLDARDCWQLKHVSPQVGLLPNLQELLLDNSPASTSLDWSGAGLTVVPRILQQLPQLESLDLSRNALQSLDGLQTLEALRVLRCSFNNLTYEGTFPLTRLAKLDDVNISHNTIYIERPLLPPRATLPIDVASTRWSRLDISNNLLETLPTEFFVPPKEFLDVTGNPLRFVDLSFGSIGPKFPHELTQVEGIIGIALGVSPLAELPDDWGVAARTLKSLDLFLDVLTYDAFTPSLLQLRNLTKLEIGGNPVTRNGRLPPVIWELPALERILTDCVGLSELPDNMWGPSLTAISFLRNKRLTSVPAPPDGHMVTNLNLRATGVSQLPQWHNDTLQRIVRDDPEGASDHITAQILLISGLQYHTAVEDAMWLNALVGDDEWCTAEEEATLGITELYCLPDAVRANLVATVKDFALNPCFIDDLEDR